MTQILFNYINHWEEYVFRDTANGRSSEDTKNTYRSNIQIFLSWCEMKQLDPLTAKEDDIQQYRELLWSRRNKISTVALKLTAIRRFYESAVRRDILTKNPAKNVYAGEDPEADILPTIRYLTLEQSQELLNVIPEDNESDLRARVVIGLMLGSGFRTIEVQRASVEDIDLDRGSMIVKGKRRSRMSQLRDDQIAIVRRYLRTRNQDVKQDESGTPLISSLSPKNLHGRISRRGLREIVDYWLSLMDMKQEGFSCHALRHTCATLLLQATGNIRFVQEQLGHRDINQTAKYAHIQEKMLKRYADAIPLKI